MTKPCIQKSISFGEDIWNTNRSINAAFNVIFALLEFGTDAKIGVFLHLFHNLNMSEYYPTVQPPDIQSHSY